MLQNYSLVFRKLTTFTKHYYYPAVADSLNGIPKSDNICLASLSVFAVVTKVIFIPC
jgi:hypothetical protein